MINRYHETLNFVNEIPLILQKIQIIYQINRKGKIIQALTS